MAGETDDAEAAAGRIEAALERIAKARPRDEGAAEDGPHEELAARIDGLINRLRAALGRTD